MKCNTSKQLKPESFYNLLLWGLVNFSMLYEVLMNSMLRIASAFSSPLFMQFLHYTVMMLSFPLEHTDPQNKDELNYCKLHLGVCTYDNVTFVCWTGRFNQQNHRVYGRGLHRPWSLINAPGQAVPPWKWKLNQVVMFSPPTQAKNNTSHIK